MKTEYLYTTEQKAELADIDRQIAKLFRRKIEIQCMAQVRYIPEEDWEIEAVKQMRKNTLYGIHGIAKEAGTIRILGDWKND